MLLRMLHLFGIVGWLGSAAADIVLEVIRKRSASAAEQRSLLRLHFMTDMFVEGPGLLVAAVTGALLLEERGWLAAGAAWPTWFQWKIAAAATVVVTNAFSIIFLAVSYRAARRIPAGVPLREDASYRLWERLNLVPWLGIPCAITALALAGLYGG